MRMAPALITCPTCSCAARIEESHCPHCGAKLRQGDGSVPRTAAAVLLGLSAAVSAANCGGPVAVPDYGIATVGNTSGGGGSADAGPDGSDGGQGGSKP